MRISAILFDMDGVIINSRSEIELFWNEWAEKVGIILSEKDIEDHIHGCPATRTLEMLFKNTSDEFKMQIMNCSHTIGQDVENLVMPGFKDLIDCLDEIKMPWGIVTSHLINSATRIVKALHIQDRLKVLVTADQVEKGKPHPDPYILGNKRLGLEAEQVLVFEDSISGCTAALKAGNAVIGLNVPKMAKSLLSLGVEDVLENFEGIVDKEMKCLRIGKKLILNV
ncbi:MAG TPA: HAD-IA family hydrolase [Cytophagales bacterium]|nr:HAD-IA family hydrolase [Cytophagales bacterium]